MKERLVFKRTRGDGCCDCGLQESCRDEGLKAKGSSCDISFYYKLVEEEQKIQTEHQWKKERFVLLRDSHKPIGSDIEAEYIKLGTWMNDNPPTEWVQATKENVKFGCELKNDCGIFYAEHIIKTPLYKSDNCVITDKKDSWMVDLRDFEINILREEL